MEKQQHDEEVSAALKPIEQILATTNQPQQPATTQQPGGDSDQQCAALHRICHFAKSRCGIAAANMCKDMCIDMCLDMCLEMWLDMCTT